MGVILGTDRTPGKARRHEEQATTNGGMNPASHHTLPVKLKTWVGFATMCVGMFMAILDVQIVATSLPTIQQALGFASDQMVWVQTAYLTAEIVAIPLTGYLTGVLGIRWLFVAAVTRWLHVEHGVSWTDLDVDFFEALAELDTHAPALLIEASPIARAVVATAAITLHLLVVPDDPGESAIPS